MKRIVTFTLCLISVAILYAGTCKLDYFRATASSDEVKIEWATTSEVGVAYFEVERLAYNGFFSIQTQKANGKISTYKYTDTDVFTKDAQLQASSTATYRLKIVYNSQSEQPTYSNEVVVTRNVSGIKRTLGMLKEMFK